jgi:hypothetical protein
MARVSPIMTHNRMQTTEIYTWGNDIRQIETVHTAEPLVPDHSSFEAEIAIAKLKKYKSPGSVQEKQVGLKLNVTYQVLVYTEDVMLT